MKKMNTRFPGKNILVVEDHFINRELLTGILKLMDCNVIVAEDGEQALSVLQNQNIDLILMDVNMPKKDGYQTTREIRDLQSPQASVPIIAVTACAMEGDREKCIDSGMNDYISKPMDFELLEEILKKHIYRT